MRARRRRRVSFGLRLPCMMYVRWIGWQPIALAVALMPKHLRVVTVFSGLAFFAFVRNASLNSGVWKLRRLAKGLRYRCA